MVVKGPVGEEYQLESFEAYERIGRFETPEGRRELTVPKFRHNLFGVLPGSC